MTRYLYIVLLGVFLSACSGYYLTVKSNPEGAVVYIVPKIVWQSDTVQYSDPNNLGAYVIKKSTTPVYTLEIPPGDYMVLCINGHKKKMVPLSLKKTHSKRKPKTIDVALP